MSTAGDVGIRPRLYRRSPDPGKVDVFVLGVLKCEWRVEMSEAKFQTHRLVRMIALTVRLVNIGLGARRACARCCGSIRVNM